ncbi:MAG: response regulator, partial [Planctomycetales bacterium]
TTIPNEIRVLLVEDDEVDAKRVQRALTASKSPKIKVDHINRMAVVENRLELGSPVDLIIVDLGLPDSKGVDSVMPLLDMEPRLPIVVFTGREDNDSLVESLLSIGVQDYIVKGTENDKSLQRCVRYAVERHRLLERIRKQREDLKRAMRQLEAATQ